jgi:hypothetical protein
LRFLSFVVAYATRLIRLPFDDTSRQLLDGVLLHCDEAAMNPGSSGLGTPLGAGSVGWHLAGAVAQTVAKDSIAIACANATEEERFEWGFFGPPDPLYRSTIADEQREQAQLLREVIGNPFRPVMFDPRWRIVNDGAALKIAQEIEEEEAFDDMRILADALEEAGCTDPDLLAHLRSPGPHVHGCWALDLVLARS